MQSQMVTVVRTTTFYSLLCCILWGCEAELKLDAVTAEKSKSTLRHDQYQAMALAGETNVLFGSNGVVLRSKDHGLSWERTVIDGNPNFISADQCADGTLVALSFDKRVYTSEDTVTWKPQPINTTKYLQKVVCAPDNSLWVTASFSTLLHSTDGGLNWTAVSMNEDALLTHVQFFKVGQGVAAGEFGLFFTTKDAGKSWQAGGAIGQEFYPIDVWFRNPLTGWAVGLNGVVFATTDGGASWERQDTQGTVSPLYGLVGDDHNVFALGDQGTVLRLVEDHWQALDVVRTPIHFNSGTILTDQQILLVAGGWGTIVRVQIPTS